MQEKIMRLPYQGSKQALVAKIYNAINEDIDNTNDLFSTQTINTIYDLFCGGGSVGYYFYNKGWQVFMNDIQKPLIELHEVLNMQNSLLTNDLLFKWISREEFFELNKRQDWYGELIRICWSFGNGGGAYLFGKDIENYKKQLHFVVVNKCLDAGRNFLQIIGKADDWQNFSKIYDIVTKKERRLFIRNYVLKNTINKPFGKHNDVYLYCDKQDYDKIKDLSIVERAKWLNENYKQIDDSCQLNRIESLQALERLEQLQQLQQLQQLERLEQLQQLERHITFSCKNYYDIDFQANSIIYADPPYINTAGYNNQKFDFDKFDNLVREMKNKNVRVYISEYTNHNNEWREVASFDKFSLFSNLQETKTLKQEKIFCNI